MAKITSSESNESINKLYSVLFRRKKRQFFMLKTRVPSARIVGFSLKKRWFLKLVSIFIGIKIVYYTDYQCLSCNVKNRCFSSTNDNTLTNIGCMCGQNSLFVNLLSHLSQGRMCKKLTHPLLPQNISNEHIVGLSNAVV